MGRLRFRIRALIAVTACALTAPLLATGPVAAADAPRASADEVWDALDRAIAATTQHAVDVGGYRVDHSWRWSDGSSAEWWEAYEANGSKEVHLRYVPTAGPDEPWHFPWQQLNFVADAQTRTYSWAFQATDADEKEALRILKAPLEGWMVQDYPWRGGFPGITAPPNEGYYFSGTMLNNRGAAGRLLDVLVSRVTGGDIGPSGRIYATLAQWNVDTQEEETAELTVELDSGGQVTSFTFTRDDADLSLTVTFSYAADLVAAPVGPDVVSYDKFARARQSIQMTDRLYDLANDTRIESMPATPRSLMSEAKRQVAAAYKDGWRIPVRLIRLKQGVRFQAKNPFTGQKFAYDLILQPPYYVVPEISGLIRPRAAHDAP
jgi:hypothetical protein